MTTRHEPAKVFPSPPTSPTPAARKSVSRNVGANIPAATNIAKQEIKEKKNTADITHDVARPITPPLETAEPPSPSKVADIDTWIAALDLANGKCGAAKKTRSGSPCRNNTSAARMSDVRELVRTLVKLQSDDATGFEVKLDMLAKTAHCYNHDDPPTCDLRVGQWLKQVPGGPRSPSIQRRLRCILIAAPEDCTSLTKARASTPERNCQIQTSKDTNYFCRKTIDRMVQTATAPTDQDDALDYLAKVLRYYTLCHVHQKTPHKQQTSWITSIDQFTAECEQERGLRHEAPTAPPSPGVERKSALPADYWDKSPITSKFHVLGKGDMTFDGDTPQEMIAKITPTALLGTEKSSGVLYVYKVTGNDDLVKIGYTCKSVEARHKEWQKDCNRDPVCVFPQDAKKTFVPHAHRVERLVHAELMKSRVRIYCDRCRKQHNEWFQVSGEEAIASIERWSRWMSSAPYVKTKKNDGRFEWKLAEAEVARLDDIDEFMKYVEEFA